MSMQERLQNAKTKIRVCMNHGHTSLELLTGCWWNKKTRQRRKGLHDVIWRMLTGQSVWRCASDAADDTISQSSSVHVLYDTLWSSFQSAELCSYLYVYDVQIPLIQLNSPWVSIMIMKEDQPVPFAHF